MLGHRSHANQIEEATPEGDWLEDSSDLPKMFGHITTVEFIALNDEVKRCEVSPAHHHHFPLSRDR